MKKAFFTPNTYYIIYARVKKKGGKREEEGGRRKAREGEGAIKSHHTERKDEGEIRARRFKDKHEALRG
jgi:hypothetical protein